MIGVNQVNLFFGDRAIFNDLSFIVNKTDRIGLVGRNGAGKTTMLKSLAGIQKLDSGDISMPTGTSIGYLPQDMDFEGGRTVWKETETAFGNTLSLQNELDDINYQLATRTDYETESYLGLLDKLAEINEKLALQGVDTIEAEIEKILLGLGFKKTDFERLTDEFSGGWRMRIELAKILLQKSDVLLLDEPTNHLDIESIQWLETFLKTYPGAIVLISHDRAFLDNLTNRTIEISLGRIYDYAAPYTRYLELRKERRALEMAAYQNQQKQIKDTEAFIDRFRAKASKAIQVQSRIKALNKLDRIEIDEEDTSAMRFSFFPAPHSGKVSLMANEVKKSYDNQLIFEGANLTIERGQKVAFVGKNGEGKSTFTRLIMGEDFDSGSIEKGYQVEVGYFAQNQSEILDKEKTVFETIDEAARGEIRTKIRSLLGSFLFGGEDVDKKVKVLSGGERARLAMCKLLLEPVNLLLLDEPTNHLDIRSKEILKDALLRYNGTLIIISHDRDFLKGLVSKVYEFNNKRITEHLGGIDYFLSQKKFETISDWEGEKSKKNNTSEKNTKTADSENNYQRKKDLKKEVRALQNQVSKLEKEIEESEALLESLNVKLSSADKGQSQSDILNEWQEADKKLKRKMKSWEDSSEELESKQNELDSL